MKDSFPASVFSSRAALMAKIAKVNDRPMASVSEKRRFIITQVYEHAMDLYGKGFFTDQPEYDKISVTVHISGDLSIDNTYTANIFNFDNPAYSRFDNSPEPK